MKKGRGTCKQCGRPVTAGAALSADGLCTRCASPRAQAIRGRAIVVADAARIDKSKASPAAIPASAGASQLRKTACKACGAELLAPGWDKGPLCAKCADAAARARAAAGKPNTPARTEKSRGKKLKGGKLAPPPMPVSRPAPAPPPCAYCNPAKASKAAVSLRVNRPICGPCRERLLKEARARGVGVGPGGLCPGCGEPRSLVIQESRPKLCNACSARLANARAARRKRPPNAGGVPDERPQSTSVRAYHGGAPGLGKRA